MTLNWDTHKTVLVDGSASAAASETSGIFTPACPAGYGAMGAVAVKDGRAPVVRASPGQPPISLRLSLVLLGVFRVEGFTVGFIL